MILAAILALLLYLAPLTYIVYRTHWVRTPDEFNVANRALPATLVFASVSATFIGPGFSMGFIGKGYSFGLAYWVMGILYGLQTILVGLFIAPRLRDIEGARTLGGVYGARSGLIAQVLVGVLSVGLCAGFAAVMLKAGGTLLQSFFGWSLWMGVLATAVVTTIYTVSGGLRASVATDAFQFIVFAIVLPVLLLVLYYGGHFDVSSAVATSNTLSLDFIDSTGSLGLLALGMAFLFGESVIPPYASRALGSRTAAVARRGFVMSGVFAILWFLVVVVIGIAGRQIVGDGVEEDNVLLEMLAGFPAVARYFVGIALIGVVMSSLDSLLNSGGVAFSEDVIRRCRPGISDRWLLVNSRGGVILIAIVGAIGALKVETIVGGLLKCYAVWAPAIVPSLVYLLLVKRVRKAAVVASVLAGTIAALLVELNAIPTAIAPIIVGMSGAILALAFVHIGGKLCGRS